MRPSDSQKLTIAIDGPAGASKSTIAARLARKLGYVNLESGAMYRALALKAIRNDISFDDEPALLALAQRSKIRLEPTREGNRVFLDGMDVSQRIREQDVTNAASRVSIHPSVRQWMVERQRELGTGGGVIMEGRDIGTKVFPHAEVKVFLDAHPEVRQQRRVLQRAEKGVQVEPQRIAAELQERDLRDRTRAASPLVPADDAVIIDSSQLSIDQVVDKVEALVRKKLRD